MHKRHGASRTHSSLEGLSGRRAVFKMPDGPQMMVVVRLDLPSGKKTKRSHSGMSLHAAAMFCTSTHSATLMHFPQCDSAPLQR